MGDRLNSGEASPDLSVDNAWQFLSLKIISEVNNIATRILYLGILWWLGWFCTFSKKTVRGQGTLFDHQNWSIWLAVISATLIHVVGIAVGLMSKNRPLIWLAYIWIEATILIGLLYFYRSILKKTFGELGVSCDRLSLRLIIGLRWIIGYFIIGNISFFVLSFALLRFLKKPMLLEALISRQRQAMSGGSVLLGLIETEVGAGFLWMPVIFLVVIGPLLEELVFRGFMYGPIRHKMGPIFAILMTAILFMLGHGQISQSTFVFGLLFAYLYESTQSLVPSILFHILVNLRMVEFYFKRNGALSSDSLMSEAGWKILFFGLMFSIVEVTHRKMIKRGIRLPKPLAI